MFDIKEAITEGINEVVVGPKKQDGEPAGTSLSKDSLYLYIIYEETAQGREGL
jgi:hypothetical protein